MQQFFEYVGHHPWYVAAAVVIALAVAVYEFREARAAFASIGPSEVVRLMNGGAILVDVRGQQAFEAGHIAGARFVPGDQIANGAESLSRFKDKPIIAYCESGMTAGAAARHLSRLGFQKVYNLRGGLAAWRQDNMPLVKA
jgi:rhodanese-related sulfurtransferase